MNLCVIYNAAPHYREAVFRMIDAEYDCDWYFGHQRCDIKEMDVSLLKHVSYYKTYGNPGKLSIKTGLFRLLFRKKYKTFLLLPETRCVSDWIFIWLATTFFPKKKVYLWTHGWYGKEEGMEAKMKLWMYRKVAGTFVYSNYARELLIKEGIPSEKLFTIHNSLQYDKQKSLREKLTRSSVYLKHFGNNNPTILFIGRLTKVKQLDLLIDSVCELKNKGELYNLVFVGDGEERSNLLNQVEQLGLKDQTWLYGACYDEKTNAELIYNADLCVAPGNVGLTAMHTMVFGTPVISHNCFKWQMPEFEAIIPGKTGDFFDYNSKESLINAISRWFIEKKDNRESVRLACYKEIDTAWNPYYQIDVIKAHIK